MPWAMIGHRPAQRGCCWSIVAWQPPQPGTGKRGRDDSYDDERPSKVESLLAAAAVGAVTAEDDEDIW